MTALMSHHGVKARSPPDISDIPVTSRCRSTDDAFMSALLHTLTDSDAPDGPGSLAEMGSLIGDPVRAAILHHLGDGSRRPAGELAHLAGASPQAASAHLARLVDGGLLAVEREGRHRFYRIASGDAAEAIEALIAWIGSDSRPSVHPPEMRRARLWYDHLAGQLGVAICDALVKRSFLILGADGPQLSEAGRIWCTRCGLDPVPRTRRPVVRLCLDWTERHHHVGGGFGAELAQMMLAAGHVISGPRRRSLRVTAAGETFLSREFRIGLPPDPTRAGWRAVVDDDAPTTDCRASGCGHPGSRLPAHKRGE